MADVIPGEVQLVVFDLGRVLIRICNNWAHATERAGITPPAIMHDPQGKAELVALMVEHETGRLDNDGYFNAVAQKTGLTPAQASDIMTAWLIEPFHDIETLITNLQSRGVKTACLSNTNPLHWDMMHCHPTCGLPMSLLDHRFASHFIGVMKPDPRIYQYVEEQTGFGPQSILFFDDHEPNVIAAIECGWKAHRIDPTLPQTVVQMTPVLKLYGLLS